MGKWWFNGKTIGKPWENHRNMNDLSKKPWGYHGAMTIQWWEHVGAFGAIIGVLFLVFIFLKNIPNAK